LKVAKKYFHGTFIANSQNVNGQKLFEYKHNGHTYRCYVDIYNENEREINIIEVKATTNKKYRYWEDKDGKNQGLRFTDTRGNRGGTPYPLFVKNGNIWHLNTAASTVNEHALENFEQKKGGCSKGIAKRVNIHTTSLSNGSSLNTPSVMWVTIAL
jgi:hypothetical protein